ncbi:MAG TPA: formylglycine-generating enzyme family protein, partial [Urbifossiella sp.]
FVSESEISAKRALLIALGDYPPESLPEAEREALAAQLLSLYREHADSGLHAAIDWLLRQKWRKNRELEAIDADLLRLAKAQGIAAQGRGKDWFVNGEGQAYATIRGPVEFKFGSPALEKGRFSDEDLHSKRIGRTYAIATREVTVEQFLRFRPNHYWEKRYSPCQDTPAVRVMWYDVAAYCNWLSEQEGIPRDQWCYAPNADGEFAEGMTVKPGHLSLAGYRLPTEAEWEYACRAGSNVLWHFGRGEELLPRYGWYVKNAGDRAWPVGQLRPNERGLFDVLGNALEWVEDPGLKYATSQREDFENNHHRVIYERTSRLLRGGSFDLQPVFQRSADREFHRPGNINYASGLRPARTIRNN